MNLKVLVASILLLATSVFADGIKPVPGGGPVSGNGAGLTNIPESGVVGLVADLARKVGTNNAVPVALTNVNNQVAATNYSGGALRRLVFVGQPTDTLSGFSIAPDITVQLQDGFGNNLTTSGVSVTLSLVGTSESLSGGLSLNTTAGLATFPNVTPNGMTGYPALVASATGYDNAISAPFLLEGTNAAGPLTTFDNIDIGGGTLLVSGVDYTNIGDSSTANLFNSGAGMLELNGSFTVEQDLNVSGTVSGDGSGLTGVVADSFSGSLVGDVVGPASATVATNASGPLFRVEHALEVDETAYFNGNVTNNGVLAFAGGGWMENANGGIGFHTSNGGHNWSLNNDGKTDLDGGKFHFDDSGDTSLDGGKFQFNDSGDVQLDGGRHRFLHDNSGQIGSGVISWDTSGVFNGLKSSTFTANDHPGFIGDGGGLTNFVAAVQAGTESVTVLGTAITVTFVTPFPDANYNAALTPIGVAIPAYYIASQTANGFTTSAVTLTGTVGWTAIRRTEP